MFWTFPLMKQLLFSLALLGNLLIVSAVSAEEKNLRFPPVPSHWESSSWEKGSAQSFWKKQSSTKESPQILPLSPLQDKVHSSAPQASSSPVKKAVVLATPRLLDRQTEK